VNQDDWTLRTTSIAREAELKSIGCLAEVRFGSANSKRALFARRSAGIENRGFGEDSAIGFEESAGEKPAELALGFEPLRFIRSIRGTDGGELVSKIGRQYVKDAFGHDVLEFGIRRERGKERARVVPDSQRAVVPHHLEAIEIQILSSYSGKAHSVAHQSSFDVFRIGDEKMELPLENRHRSRAQGRDGDRAGDGRGVRRIGQHVREIGRSDGERKFTSRIVGFAIGGGASEVTEGLRGNKAPHGFREGKSDGNWLLAGSQRAACGFNTGVVQRSRTVGRKAFRQQQSIALDIAIVDS
jgi:hypothetical protein